MELGLAGKSAIVCGASSGLGLGVATALAAEGVKVTMVARRAQELAERAAVIGGQPVAADLADPPTAERVVDRAVSWAGGLDIVVWNSGGPPTATASQLDPDDLRAALDLLYVPAVRLIRAALPHLRLSPAGRVLAITASGVKEPMPQIALSNAVRPGLAGYLKSLASDLAPTGITVNCLAPGRILTDRLRQVLPEGPRSGDVEEIPMGRFGSPDDIGAVATFLASERASYVTGTTINVDGGLARAIF
ncbi:SDR family oxidoreductase [Streptomyces tendae]|uniref:SDR family oxidoreductase n=1 Tax=Streptomyces tendae TaxID=1932 RepID=UPI0037878322